MSSEIDLLAFPAISKVTAIGNVDSPIEKENVRD